jgi:very-short-patch-repair endonuclease
VTRTLDDADVASCNRIPCTSLARTLVDLAGVVPPRVLRRALEQALILRIFDRGPLDAALARSNARRGMGTLRRLLAEFAYEPAFTRSELERAFLELVRRAGLPSPVVNAFITGHEVDFHWPAHRLVVETDGGATHANAFAFERDRQRDLDLELEGWHVLRISWRQVIQEPHRVAAILRAWLGWHWLSGRSSGSRPWSSAS